MKRTICLVLFALSCLLTTAITFAQEGLPVEVVMAYPAPNVSPLPVTDHDLRDRLYKKLLGGAQIFDAPGGNLIETTGAGYGYVTIEDIQGDWMAIEPGRWVSSTSLTEDVLVSTYSGVFLPEGADPYPMGWMIDYARPSLSPGLDAAPDAPMLSRYTRVNIYASADANGARWLQVGGNQWVRATTVAQLAPIARPAGVDTYKWVSVDLQQQTMTVYEGDRAVFATLISSGVGSWGTRNGLFHVGGRYDRATMSGASSPSDSYLAQEVPWVMYFDGDIALHGTYWHDSFGYRQSHGCVNLSITDAKWLYDWSAAEPNLAVYIYGA